MFSGGGGGASNAAMGALLPCSASTCGSHTVMMMHERAFLSPFSLQCAKPTKPTHGKQKAGRDRQTANGRHRALSNLFARLFSPSGFCGSGGTGWRAVLTVTYIEGCLH